MFRDILELPVHLRRRLADALDAGILVPHYNDGSIRLAMGINDHDDIVFAVIRELENTGMTGSSAAAWIRLLEEAESKDLKPDLVWSGPEISGLHARDTRRVYEELVSSAKRSLWASTYAFFDGPKAFGHLGNAMDSTPDLDVTILLNIQRSWGDSTESGELVRRFADKFWVDDWPGVRRPKIFYDPRSLDIGKPGGVLHSKAMISDDETLFVTSANLTEAALDRNIEVGVLLRDRTLALNLSSHFQSLIDKGLLSPLPMK